MPARGAIFRLTLDCGCKVTYRQPAPQTGDRITCAACGQPATVQDRALVNDA